MIPAVGRRTVCPVYALAKYIQSRPDGEGHLFLRPDGKLLSVYLITKVLRACIAKLGLQPGLYSSHSFRAGRTTDLVEMGFKDAIIRESVRWKSAAFIWSIYVRFDVFRLPKGVPDLRAVPLQ